MKGNYGRAPAAVLTDSTERADRNRAGLNHYDSYMPEILGQLGVFAKAYPSLGELLEGIDGHAVAFLGEANVGARDIGRLTRWVEGGGTLVGALTTGADGLFGVAASREVHEVGGGYSVQAYAVVSDGCEAFCPSPGAAGNPAQAALPVLSRWLRCEPMPGAARLFHMLDPFSFNSTGFGPSGAKLIGSGAPALIMNAVGRGRSFYLTFSLAKTVCLLHQGRPVDGDWDGDGMLRAEDGIVLPPFMDFTVPYADYYLHMLQAITDLAGVPSLFQLPPQEHEPADLAVYFGGDDECDRSGVQMAAAKAMHGLGLPYHINLMPAPDGGGFALGADDAAALRTLGCETSIHYDFLGMRAPIREGALDAQLRLYKETFGETPVCGVNHYFMWSGWADIPRWLCERGVKGDNTRPNSPNVRQGDSNPIDSFGFGFGTALPHFVMDDWAHGNERISLAQLPVMLYEARMGGDTSEADAVRLGALLDRAAMNGWPLNYFVHPVYIVRDPRCLNAIRHCAEHIARRGYRAAYMGTDAMCLWWHDRAASRVTGSDGRYSVRAESGLGAVIRLPDQPYRSCRVDGASAVAERRSVAGRPCLLVAVAQGDHEVTVV